MRIYPNVNKETLLILTPEHTQNFAAKAIITNCEIGDLIALCQKC